MKRPEYTAMAVAAAKHSAENGKADKGELDKLRAEIAEWSEQEEDVLSYAQFPKVALDFFEKRRNKKAGINGSLLDKKNMIHPV